MNVSTRHTDAARRVGAFVHQTMMGRGMRCLRTDLEAALVELSPEQLHQVSDTAQAVAKGADSRDHVSLLAALRSISSRPARLALSRNGILYRADVLLPLAAGDRTGVAFARDLATLQREAASTEDRAAARAQLLSQCGPLTHEDLVASLGATVPAAPQPLADDVQVPPPSLDRVEEDSTDHTHESPPGGTPGVRHASPQAPPRRQVKVFGKAAALTWETAPMRTRAADAPALTTVMIEGATARGDGTFAWDAKIVFACTARELPQLLAVLMGWTNEVEFAFHGGDVRKKLRVEHQAHGLFVKLQGPGATHSVPVDDADRYAVAMLVLHALTANEPLGDAQAVLAVCRDVMSPARFLWLEPNTAAVPTPRPAKPAP